MCADGPRVSIKLGEPLELERIEEGHDVYFTCLVDANPRPELVNWFYNVSLAVSPLIRYLDTNDSIPLRLDYKVFNEVLCVD